MSYVFRSDDRCFQYYRYAERTEQNGILKARNGREVVHVEIAHLSDDYMIYVFCPVLDNGYCNPDRVSRRVLTLLMFECTCLYIMYMYTKTSHYVHCSGIM